MQTIDFVKTHKDLYSATSKIKEVVADKGVFLQVEGQGEPGGEVFQKAIEALYSVAYTGKFYLKQANVVDFKVSKLEGLWDIEDPAATPPSEWRWRLLIRIPDTVTEAHMVEVRRIVGDRKGLNVSGVKRKTFKEGRCLQVMHVGPYEQVGSAYGKLSARAEELGLKGKCPAHEIYLSDPRRVAPEKLKTIVRLPVTGKK